MRISEDQALESDQVHACLSHTRRIRAGRIGWTAAAVILIAMRYAQVARTVEQTQARVERYYYELREKLFEFDEVLAAQREDVYGRRAAVVSANGDEMSELMARYAAETASDIVRANWPAADGAPDDGAALDGAGVEKLVGKLRQFFPDLDVGPIRGTREEASAAVAEAVTSAVARKESSLEGVRAGLGLEAARFIALTQFDTLWKDHMKAMNSVKDFAGLRAYAQEDPLQVHLE